MARFVLKKSSQTLWIVCEGETERRYLQNFRATEQKKCLRIRPNTSQHKRADLLVNEAVQFTNGNDFAEGDLVVCLFDRDNNTNKELEKAKKIADENNIKIYFSNPCFEVWLLSHYEKCSSCDPNQVRSRIKKYNLNTRGKTDLYEVTKPNLHKAIKRGKLLCQNINSKGIEIFSIHSNPVTEIHKLLEFINSFD